MENVVLRAYRPADAQALFLLDQECFAEPFRFTRQAMRGFAGARNAISLVAVAEGQLAGFVIVHEEGRRGSRHGYVVTLDVAPAWRRRRLASRLLREAELRFAARKISLMALHVHTGNDAAIRFYESEKYERTGIERDFYGSGLHALVYSKLLT